MATRPDVVKPAEEVLSARRATLHGPPATVPGRRWREWARAFRSPVTAGAALTLLTIVGGAALAPWVAPYDPLAIDIWDRLAGPSPAHWFGTDDIGRDLLSNILFATRISIVVGLGSTLLGAAVAIPLGLLAGFLRGPVDDVIMRVMDGLLAIPGILVALTLVTSFGTSLPTLMLAVGISLIPGTTRIVRAGALVEQAKDYVMAATVLGGTTPHVLARHILPNVFSTVLVQLTLGITLGILTEAFMSFVGLGVQPPAASLGTLLSAGYALIGLAPWYVTFPGLVIFLMVWSLNVLGDSLRDLLDPRLRQL